MAKQLPPPRVVTDLIWLQTSFIGDVVLTSAALELAHREFPNARQHFVTTSLGAKVIEAVPWLTSRVVFAKGKKSTLAAFADVKRALEEKMPAAAKPVVLQTHRSYRSSFLCRYLGWPTITYAETAASWLAGTRVPRVAPLHEAARIALLLEPFGVARQAIIAARPKLGALPLDPAAPWTKAVEAASGKLIGVAPGSVWGTKRWTKEGFAALTKRLLALEAHTVVLLGSAAERELATEVEQLAGPSPRLLNLAGETSLDDLRRIYPRLALLVSNDSSPLHYASSFNVPTVALFGATIPAMGFGPLSDRALTVGVSGLSCRPCSDHGPATCPLGHFKCMRDLGIEQVYAACASLLA